MIRKEPVTQEDLQTFLKGYIRTQAFSLKTGVFLISMVCLLLTIIGSVSTFLLSGAKVSTFWSIVFFIFSGAAGFGLPIWLGLKSEKFKSIFEIATIPVTLMISVLLHEKYLLITNAFLLFVLAIVFLCKYSGYSTYKNVLKTDNVKVVFDGILTKCYKQDMSNSVRYSNIHTLFSIDDGSLCIDFSLDNLKILQLHNAGYVLPTEKNVGKHVIVSFLSTMPDTLLSFKLVDSLL
ncbi:hypothetical protein A8C56_20990 [Niabella ginsenosidivorans]|uniref:Uncharacterized protein n=1 Tax=Niabella ginsenosidivorans TaxID=1176587 RepID=A0A1A9I711_9BACT|nr:hypothetical protein [Niabella ginsenosidivorans]ANH83125.1 hypothetical protein A8C56_20990 [Niabella ginsenosidivorans]